MKNLTDDNDPLLFAIDLPAGKLIVQYLEVMAAVQAALPSDQKEPDPSIVLKCLRECSRTPDVAKSLSDPMLLAAWMRVMQAAESAGNG